VITEERLREFFAALCRVRASRKRVPSPSRRFTRYTHHRLWHVCPYDQRLTFDDPSWIEVAW
jgi:hypothetical protein